MRHVEDRLVSKTRTGDLRVQIVNETVNNHYRNSKSSRKESSGARKDDEGRKASPGARKVYNYQNCQMNFYSSK